MGSEPVLRGLTVGVLRGLTAGEVVLSDAIAVVLVASTAGEVVLRDLMAVMLGALTAGRVEFTGDAKVTEGTLVELGRGGVDGVVVNGVKLVLEEADGLPREDGAGEVLMRVSPSGQVEACGRGGGAGTLADDGAAFEGLETVSPADTGVEAVDADGDRRGAVRVVVAWFIVVFELSAAGTVDDTAVLNVIGGGVVGGGSVVIGVVKVAFGTAVAAAAWARVHVTTDVGVEAGFFVHGA